MSYAFFLSDSNQNLLPALASFIRLGSHLHSNVAIRIVKHGRKHRHVQIT